EMTQQNAALVEESSASARSLEEQSEKMIRLMSFFDIGANKQVKSSVPAQQPSVQKPAVTKVLPAQAHTPHNPVDANEDADWEEF
ncbi:MAG: methyl-accepting chemotaxis protein, partial [Methylocystaceae bacterium]|nr:methyl-accepting chemotaxis protein [Methylocystaceae bacterium]